MTSKLTDEKPDATIREHVTESGDPRSRAFEMTLDINATPEDIWRALTSAEELVRWFPQEATITPGPGGTVHWSWQKHGDWDHRIDIWEPLKRLRLMHESQVALEFTLETHQGGTRLRMVHSGFGFGGAWDDEFDGIRSGWPYQLSALRFYLERHRGHDRHFATAHAKTSLSLDATWARLVSADGFGLTASSSPGTLYTVQAATGDRFTGPVFQHLPHRGFSGLVPAMDDGLVRLAVYREQGRSGALASLVTYAPEPPEPVTSFATRAQALLNRLFPADALP